MKKKVVREVYLSQRNKYTIGIINEYSKKICNKFIKKFIKKKTDNIHIFIPMIERGEINTWFIINKLIKMGKNVISSSIDIKKKEMNHHIINDCLYNKNDLGMFEPVTRFFTNIDEFSIVIIPLLGYDKKGNRVGYGYGYYDRFLKRCHTNTLKIGISMEYPILTISDINNNDIKMDYCITPNKIYKFKKN